MPQLRYLSLQFDWLIKVDFEAPNKLKALLSFHNEQINSNPQAILTPI
jgi:hypothetical protein